MDLEKNFEGILEQLWGGESSASFRLLRHDLLVQNCLTTRGIVCFAGGVHDYGGVRIGMVDLYATKSAIRALGALILGTSMACESPRLEFLSVCNRNEAGASTIWQQRKYLIVERPLALEVPGCSVRCEVTQLDYEEREVQKHPWITELPKDSWDLPIITVEEFGDSSIPARFRKGEAVTLSGSLEALLRLGCLFLDLGAQENALNECCLEGEVGFRGVAPSSSELRVFLPGSFHYNSHLADGKIVSPEQT